MLTQKKNISLGIHNFSLVFGFNCQFLLYSVTYENGSKTIINLFYNNIYSRRRNIADRVHLYGFTSLITNYVINRKCTARLSKYIYINIYRNCPHRAPNLAQYVQYNIMQRQWQFVNILYLSLPLAKKI